MREPVDPDARTLVGEAGRVADGGAPDGGDGTGATAHPGRGADPAAGAHGWHGHLLEGRYRFTEQLGRGAMAEVWRGYDEALARPVAIKLLWHGLGDDDSFVDRFRREAVAAARLAHPGIVSIFDTGVEAGRFYIVMELVEGRTLRDAVADRPMDPDEACRVGAEVARALDWAHEQGVVHRDVTPGNVLLDADGRAKITDFGIARAEADAERLTRTGTVLGTPSYVAPEQVLGEQVDGRADQYGLAAVLYEALSGRPPFSADSPVRTAAARLHADPEPLRRLRPDLPASLCRTVERALARDPDERFDDCATLAQELELSLATPDDEDDQPVEATAEAQPTATVVHRAGPSRLLRGGLRRVVRYARDLEPRSAVAGALGTVALTVLLITAGLLDVEADGWLRDALSGVGADAGRTTTLELHGIDTFDPFGDGAEHDELVDNLGIPGDATTWRTRSYQSPAFGGGGKPGVGVVIDLGAVHEVGLVSLRTTTPGVRYEVRTAEERSADLDDWDRQASITSSEEAQEVPLDPSVEARYLLVWITGDLRPLHTGVATPAADEVAGGFAAEFSHVEVRGRSLDDD